MHSQWHGFIVSILLPALRSRYSVRDTTTQSGTILCLTHGRKVYLYDPDVPSSSMLYTSTNRGSWMLAPHGPTCTCGSSWRLGLYSGRPEARQSTRAVRKVGTATAPTFADHGQCSRLVFVPPETLTCVTPRAGLATRTVARVGKLTAPMFTNHAYCTRLLFLPPETLACMAPRACLATRTIGRVGKTTATMFTHHGYCT